VFETYGSVRLLINNAGIETLGFTWEISLALWEDALNVNLHGVVHSVRVFLPRMLATGETCWVANLVSVGAFGVMPTQAAYILTKHAVQSFSECLYLEMQLKKAPIHVCSVLLGMLKTRIFDEKGGKGEPSGAARYRRAMREMM
jgi:short-subunit dehydrogenase